MIISFFYQTKVRGLTTTRSSKVPSSDSADVIGTEIEVRQRCSLSDHSYKALFPTCVYHIVVWFSQHRTHKQRGLGDTGFELHGVVSLSFHKVQILVQSLSCAVRSFSWNLVEASIFHALLYVHPDILPRHSVSVTTLWQHSFLLSCKWKERTTQVSFHNLKCRL